MPQDTLRISFACGQVQGCLRRTQRGAGTLIQCHCDDCRRALVWLGQSDPGQDGVQYYQTTPSNVDLNGASLAAFTWKHKRLLRWYAPCCNTAILNTLDSPKWAFASVLTKTLDDPKRLGAVKSHAFVPRDDGKTSHKNMLAFMGGFAKRVTLARLTGSWRNTPFFASHGSPTAPVRSLTHEDRQTVQL